MTGDLFSALTALQLTAVQLPQTHLPLGHLTYPQPYPSGPKSGQANAYKHTIPIQIVISGISGMH